MPLCQENIWTFYDKCEYFDTLTTSQCTHGVLKLFAQSKKKMCVLKCAWMMKEEHKTKNLFLQHKPWITLNIFTSTCYCEDIL
jgi:hypothetical protein